ncbi:hypothetical protein KUTeg_017755 [Tegillarca granosa]|uniref:Transducer of regulated CREB activity middle domain-containing protein n=1 Tax=Tegillarca granosa TaxID=220873 RepID=A0ABQ9EJQ4_TEGGR|nr:hypothetical protein KUTeg_017755 [Tegillarca granosa]
MVSKEEQIQIRPFTQVQWDLRIQCRALPLPHLTDELAQSQSRPKSCEVPNINIYPSAEQDHQGIHLPITNSTGSLPDLTVCHFQSPLTTPLDPTEDQNYPQGTPANLSPTSAHHMGMGPPQPPSPQAQSPAQRRRPQHGGPSPLVLSGSPSQQITIAHSPPVSVSNIDPSKIAMDPRLKQQYLLYIQQHRQRGPNLNHTNQSHATHPHVNHVSSNHSGPNPSPQQQHHQQGQGRHTVPQVRITSACDQNDSSQCGPPKIWHKQHKPSLSQYRNNVSEANCQSPTSPLSQTSYSPSQSPGLPPSSWNNSPFTDAYQLQQQQQQTNALQHQFEQFNMSQDNHMTTAESTLTSNGISSGIYTSPQNSINFSQAAMHGLTGSQEFHQPVHFYPQQQTVDVLNGVSLNSSPTRVVNQAQLSQHSHLQQQAATSTTSTTFVSTNTHRENTRYRTNR